MWFLNFVGFAVFLISAIEGQTYDEEGWDEASQFILTGLNQTANPCKDFFSFACGKWTKDQETKGNDDEFARLAKKTVAQVQQALQAVKIDDQKTPKYAKSVKKFFDVCVNDQTTTEQQMKQVFDAVRRTVGTPILFVKDQAERDQQLKKNIWRLAGEVRRQFGTGIFFTMKTFKYPASCSQDKYLIMLEPTPADKEKFNSTQISTMARQFAQFLNVEIDQTKLDEEIERVIALEKNLYDFSEELAALALLEAGKRTPRETGDSENAGAAAGASEGKDEEEDVSFKHLQQMFPNIDWDQYFEGMLSPEKFKTWKKDDAAFLTQHVSYFEDLNKILKNYTTETILDYIFIKIVQDWAAMTEKSDNKTKQIIECTDVTMKLFAPATVKILFDHNKWDIGEWRTDIQLMGQKIFSAFRFLISSVDWLDNEDKMNVIEKLNYIKFYSGLPIWLDNDTEVEKRTFDFDATRGVIDNAVNLVKMTFDQKMEPVINEGTDDEVPSFTVNAFYHMMKIMIQLGLALPPMYHPKYPMAVKYGNLGWTLGHELLHAFDTNNVDQVPPHMKYLMKPEARKAYESRKNCLTKQISSYCFKTHKRCASGKSTLGEIMSDIDGLKIAYMAYKFATQTIGDEPPLPKLTEYTGDQLFFMSAGRSFCSSSRLIGWYVDNKEEHGPNQARVEVSVRNFPAFAQHFKCRVGDPAAPIKTCQVWGNYYQPSKRRY